MNIQAMMKQAQKIQNDMLNAKNEIDSKVFEGSSSFVKVEMKGTKEFRPNEERDKNFTAALREAAAAGVKVLAYDCGVQVEKVWIEEKIPVEL